MSRTTTSPWKKLLATLAALAIPAVLLVGSSAPASSTSGTQRGCPQEYFCIYPGVGWNNNHPSVKIHENIVDHYRLDHGWVNFYGQYGRHRIFNNTSCTRVTLDDAPNGGNTTGFWGYLLQGESYDEDLTDFDSVTFWWYCK